jgi:cytochrome c peroxidase
MRPHLLTKHILNREGHAKLFSVTIGTIFAGALIVVAAVSGASGAAPVTYTEDEKVLILSHGPWPVKTGPDPSNRVSGIAKAIAFGKTLFDSVDLSANRSRSCATCHIPEHGHSDGQPRGTILSRVNRNTLPLFNMRLNTWYGWDGKSDSLWAQSIAPIIDNQELAMTPEKLQARIAATPALRLNYRAVFGVDVTAHDPENTIVNIAKALAAYQETLTSDRSNFDSFRDALAVGDAIRVAAYPAAAQRGAKLFVGRGRCALCHFGPNFTNGEFHNIGLPHFPGPDGIDEGRYGGIKLLRVSHYNLLGEFNDDAERATAGFTRHVQLTQHNWGEFRVPSLRNISKTAPYMHNGSKATLEDVVRHYSEVPEQRLRQDDEKLLRPLNLTDREIDDLVAFLGTL